MDIEIEPRDYKMMDSLDFQQNVVNQKQMEKLLKLGPLTALEELLEFQEDIVSELKADKRHANE
jgi:hypothetical protein